MDNVLITGGSGFVGSYLSKLLLEHGDKVIDYDIKPWGEMMDWVINPYKKEIIYEQGGIENWPHLLNILSKYKVDKIVHLASPIDTNALSKMPKLAYDIIVSGTINILEAVRLLNIKRLIYFSSIGVLPSVQYEPIDCNHPTIMATEGPINGAYGAGKIAGEAFCWAYRQSYNIDFVTIRPSAIYGFGNKNSIYLNEMIEAAVLKKPLHFSHGCEVPRDYTHVEDIAGIVLKALNTDAKKLKHRVFYGATGEKLTTAGEVAEIVKEMIPESDIQIESGLSYADKLETGFRGLLDIKPVKEQLGYTIKYADIREGIAEVIKRYREYLEEHKI